MYGRVKHCLGLDFRVLLNRDFRNDNGRALAVPTEAQSLASVLAQPVKGTLADVLLNADQVEIADDDRRLHFLVATVDHCEENLLFIVTAGLHADLVNHQQIDVDVGLNGRFLRAVATPCASNVTDNLSDRGEESCEAGSLCS